MEQCLNQGCRHSWLVESHSQLTPSLSLLTHFQAPAQRAQNLRDRGEGEVGRGAQWSSCQQACKSRTENCSENTAASCAHSNRMGLNFHEGLVFLKHVETME